MTAGAVLSTSGTNSAIMLVGPRLVYAMAEGRQLPSVFARVHSRYRTPYVAIVAVALVGWAFAMYNQFASLVAISAIARILSYVATCLALPVLRRKMAHVERVFSVPGGATIPIAATAISIWLLMGSTRNQIILSAAAVVSGAIVCGAYRWHTRNAVK